jgi:hypothetical protein
MWLDKIKMDLGEIAWGGVAWMDFWVPQNAGELSFQSYFFPF